ncbi:MAG: channel protein TolC [Candidatus Dactylopiibacterium carminicum]|uniref:Channel protein TolC n=1 Tax=Candidatus Dactylopiibacterium carminicum TaxID=857335 RepID=A0A272EN14_9RHOO|nr:TolC family outer membrane protein [Candidatus Dactylopiibacterium carminicum]KAF7597944.1 channel protein TolC [Candidatus Dactylopiibacterium carminicum]PAS91518.1 MAG: channel protein TolC [Candidatus Dactylopiibacterium carminicum]PAS93065.1 MAG: channel protein TolC [Candidatus Dactylopiibacterium carminicum]PAS96068.1 MAG: channel protein TolC [Candidatus Dactylopiibacterium carminicum]
MKRMFAMLLAVGWGAGAQAADLLGIYREATTADARYASARLQREAGQEKVVQARAGLLPSLTASAGTTYSSVDATQPLVREYGYNTNSYSLQLTQPLFRAQNWVAYEQGKLGTELADLQFVAAEMDLIVRTTQAYFDLLGAQDVLTTVTRLKTAAGEQLQLSKKSFEVGTVTVTDVNDAQSRYDIAAAQEIAAQNDVNVKREALRVLTGKEPPQLAGLRTGVMLAQPQPAVVDSWAQAAQDGNLDVQAQQLNTSIAEREVARVRAAHLPTVDAVASYGRSHATNGSSGNPSEGKTWSVGVQASLPLYQGGGTQSKVRESRALSDKAREDLETARRAAAQSARQSFLGVTSGIAQVKGYEAAVLSSRSALESNRLGYQVGVKINMDVLNAQTQLAQTEQQLAKARYDTIMAQVKLKQAVGTLSLKDLEEINALLER